MNSWLGKVNTIELQCAEYIFWIEQANSYLHVYLVFSDFSSFFSIFYNCFCSFLCNKEAVHKLRPNFRMKLQVYEYERCKFMMFS